MALTLASSINMDIHPMDNVVGYYIYDIMDADVAEIRDLLVDLETRKPRYAIIEIGGMLSIRGKMILIPWGCLQRGGMSRMDINMPSEQVQMAPLPLIPMEPTRVEEESIHSFFNIDPYWFEDESLGSTGAEDVHVPKPLESLDEITDNLELEKDEQDNEG
ncbi:MAG: PRC-barrel domain-containing protein [Nitrospinota bacterium]|nr:PRC-barrel domain-containing protein [Nitrospinota bacterium]